MVGLVAGSLDPGMRGWIQKTAKKNLWRMPTWIELEDLVSEGHLCYAKCVGRYPDVEQRMLMALVKTSFLNRTTDLAKARMRLTEVPVSALFSEEQDSSRFMEGLLGSTDDTQVLLELLKDAPWELQQVLTILAKDMTALENHRRKSNGRRETTNELICRLVGKDPNKVDYPTIIRKYLSRA